MNDFNWEESLQRLVNDIVEALPTVIGALIVFIIGYFIAAALRGATRRALNSAGFNERVDNSPAGTVTSRMRTSPSRFVAKIVFWLVMFGVISLVVALLGIEALTELVAAIYSYIPDLLAALLIFLVASALASGVAAFVDRIMGDTPTGKVIEAVLPPLIMTIAFFMILVELGIAVPIVVITYAAIMASLGLGLALAFGLGGRDVAGRLLDQGYAAGQKGVQQARQDAQVGKARAKQQGGKLKKKAQNQKRR